MRRVCVWARMCVCENALLVYFNEMSLPFENDNTGGEKTKTSKTERGMSGPDW